MSDQAKYYDYYLVEGPKVKELIQSYETVGEQRSMVIDEACRSVGAIAFINSYGLGDKGDKLRAFAWDAECTFPCPITIKERSIFNNKPVIVVRGKGNTKEGRDYNKKLDSVIKSANERLGSYPCWESYIINHYGVMRTAQGGPSSFRKHATAMLTTKCGMLFERNDALVFCIPNRVDGFKNEVSIPPDFIKLTYGQYYDMISNQ
ncbi:Eac protein [Klebsiella variicola]|uniref:Eac protein n=1 Tax=Klebsiella variicola TaxID=244366 RepID=UPI000BA055AA|nr:Eac protein [Klebsiella variicola]OZQ42886.1 Eac protein [Klebsiella variicola]